MDIEISTPVRVLLDLQEADDHLPSVKFVVPLISSKFGFDLNANMAMWIECQCFDGFVKSKLFFQNKEGHIIRFDRPIKRVE
ncbi:hypothetical protein JD974_12915 [Chromobacterium haemolyticum]|uniref:Uncharacterized protein n=1 Tax=Chromobacterium haemolyticum TaxID=394935 RepID=A0ABS3GN40_9NEIS|nr:hypothetical protein [Chromobacterium haemolyticum]MBK0415308.1 hypothetical protein [Chromobacterium haemolyticum]MBO0416476.1 hypothetical protein [Chromobacterium haemolyticum]MBO0499948.1 hypothetical protein [Chromobacterium haemolyticum]